MFHCILYDSIHFAQYTDSLARSHIFSVPMLLLCNCSRICLCKRWGKFVHLPFIATPSILARLYLIIQYLYTPGSTFSLVCDNPLIMYCLIICSSASSFISAYMSCIDMHIGMCTVMLVVCMICSHLKFLGSFSLYVYDGTTNLLYIYQGQVCIICAHCIDICAAWCIATAVIMSPHLYWP